MLSVTRGTALYTGALLGPGLLLLPGLAAAQAGPASVLAWLALLGASALLASVFAALGKAYPSARGVAGYTAAGLGERAGAAAGWCFLAGVVCGAPIVCLIGASYVTRLAGGGRLAGCAIAAGLLLAVLGVALAGIRATTGTQLVLVAALIAVVAAAVAGSAPAARAGNWVPFTPHGWFAIGRAGATLMLSFVGWEAVAPLTGRFGNPARQLPQVIAAAFAITTGLYLGLAVVTIAVLGRHAATAVPLAALLAGAIGRPGIAVAAAAAVVLTLGTTNAYITGAAALAGELTGGRRPVSQFLALIGAAGVLIIALDAAGVVTTAELVTVPTALFLAVYLGCTLSAARVLGGGARGAAVVAVLAVVIVLAFCGWALAVATAVAGATGLSGGRSRTSEPVDAAGVSGTDQPGDAFGVRGGPGAVGDEPAEHPVQVAAETGGTQVVQLRQAERVRGIQDLGERGQLQGFGEHRGRPGADMVERLPDVQVDVRKHVRQIPGLAVKRVAVQQHDRGPGAPGRQQEVVQQGRVGAVQPHIRVAEPGVELQRQPGFHPGPDDVRDQHRVGQSGAAGLRSGQVPAGRRGHLAVRGCGRGDAQPVPVGGD
jgi:amino acid efflux transporter